MPWEEIEIQTSLPYLSILDENGNLDADLEPDLPEDLLLRMHEKMLLARRFDDRMLSLQRQGRLGTFAPVRGQEAAQIGSASAIRTDDWVVPSYREHAVSAWRDLPLEGLLLYNAGYNEGGRIPDEYCDLPIAIPVGTQMIHAAGLAYGLRLQGSDSIVVTYFGDGATSEGDFHEALNFAGVFSAPVVFLCENNQYAISVPRAHQTASQTLAQKAFAYGLPCIQVDGNDVLAVHVATREAAERAREERVPTLIEMVTYRLGVHTTVDDPSKYRSEEEVEEWRPRDPLPRFQGYLKQVGLLDDEGIEEVAEAVEETIEQAVAAWQERMESAQGPIVMFDHVYAELPAYLAEQRETFEAEQAERSERSERMQSEEQEQEQRQEQEQEQEQEESREQGDGDEASGSEAEADDA